MPQTKPKLSEDILLRAARAGDVEIIEWLHQLGCPLHRQMCEQAGSCAALCWADNHGVPLGNVELKNPAVWEAYLALRHAQAEMRICCGKAAFIVAHARQPSKCMRAVAALPKRVVLNSVQRLGTIWPQR